MQDNNIVTKKKKAEEIGFNKNSLLSDFLIIIICCFAGVFCKKLINPYANLVTDALHVPGGISTAISLMFLVIAAGVTGRKWSASIMGLMQAGAALALGSVGSMGLLIPLAYIVPGVVIDIIMFIGKNISFSDRISAFAANILSSVSAALFANIFVFHLPPKALTVYLLIAALSGAVCGCLAGITIYSITKNEKKKDDSANN